VSFYSEKSKLESEFNILNLQATSTNESWNDLVQNRFYEQFINGLPKDFNSFINELVKLEQSFEKAENTINGLME